jgi:hypothetical protein
MIAGQRWFRCRVLKSPGFFLLSQNVKWFRGPTRDAEGRQFGRIGFFLPAGLTKEKPPLGLASGGVFWARGELVDEHAPR